MGGKQEGGPVLHTPSAKRDRGGIVCQKKTTRVMNIRLQGDNERKGRFHEMEWEFRVNDFGLNKMQEELVGVKGVRSVKWNKL